MVGTTIMPAQKIRAIPKPQGRTKEENGKLLRRAKEARNEMLTHRQKYLLAKNKFEELEKQIFDQLESLEEAQEYLA
jgi:hypothetical protein